MKNKKGFTIIELIIAIMIFAVVVSLAGSLFVSGFRNYNKVSERLTSQANTRFVMYDISKTLRNAKVDDIFIATGNTSITIGTTIFSYSSANSEISKTVAGKTTIIGRSIIEFYVELIDDTVNYSIKASDESAALNSSITLKEFTRPSPP